MLTFKRYLDRCRPGDCFARDFAGDAKTDRSMPEDPTWPELESYLERRGACHAAIQGARILHRSFRSYRAQTDRARSRRYDALWPR